MTYRFSNCISFGLVTALFVLATCSAFGQNGESNLEYGAVVSKIGTLRNASAIFVGGQGGWILDRNYAIGIGGYLLVNNVRARVPDTSGNDRMMASYGGLDLEYLYPFYDSFLITVQTLVGGGAIGHMENTYINPRQHYAPFFVLEPGVNIDFGISTIFRLGVGASYRFVGWLSSAIATNADMSGLMFNVSIKAGFF